MARLDYHKAAQRDKGRQGIHYRDDVVVKAPKRKNKKNNPTAKISKPVPLFDQIDQQERVIVMQCVGAGMTLQQTERVVMLRLTKQFGAKALQLYAQEHNNK